MASKRSDLHGLLVVDKPGLPRGVDSHELASGSVADVEYLPTSHDVVQRVRRWSNQRRIGHTGTLDPMASGVLVLCLGVATRLVEYYQGHDKWYTAEICLGVETDTYDAMGQEVAECPVPVLHREQIDIALAQFRGAITQKPPVYSALKQDGESLHRKARRGESVTVDARRVVIHQLDLLAFHPPNRLRVRVHCSAGTYVRSLAKDLGHALGTCAHLCYLRREAAGRFTLADAHPLETIERAAAQDALVELLLPPGDRLDLPFLVLDRESSERLGYGQKLWLPAPIGDFEPGGRVPGVDAEGRLLGILQVH